ncbi:signal transduction histidine-protein kinase BaeS [Posidoniimonas polymericola]|uniref:Signal transduction histidine-protein kinase BaeS n=1 Tax=Posidoniimonas polymericola TaxID=2528002 RepID=A0A5C5ZEM6_9BACT|nr:hypothetical protein [Posidoniimonas polymericola]TWT85608.1 signal transduction histidine-protein kinase BaeS [Posidoniimonas polymericola]
MKNDAVSPTSPHERRRKGALRLPIQKAIAVRMVTQWLCAAVVAIALTLVMQIFTNPTMSVEEQDQLRSMTWGPMVIAFLATAPMAALDMARFSHSIAGPVVRLKRVIGELADGRQVPSVEFRKADHWHDLADDFNRLNVEVERLREIERAYLAQEAPHANHDDQLVQA